MKKDAQQLTIQEIKEKTIPVLRSFGVVRSALFGSFARNEAREDSDVDILVELPKGKSLVDLVELQAQLSQTIGKNTDVVTFDSLHYLLRDRVLSELVHIL